MNCKLYVTLLILQQELLVLGSENVMMSPRNNREHENSKAILLALKVVTGIVAFKLLIYLDKLLFKVFLHSAAEQSQIENNTGEKRAAILYKEQQRHMTYEQQQQHDPMDLLYGSARYF
ncbi:unnamed protein product [Orchesella dallaii]|uniref:Uncharacterized protein n=1 Tax=Orchesella dallaii TaxID=48710 RepID=A0ABP1PJ95_9HEXA